MAVQEGKEMNKGSKDYGINAFADALRKELEAAAKKGTIYYGNSPYVPNYSVPGSPNSNIQPNNNSSSGDNSIFFILIVGMLAAVLIFKR